MLYRENGQFKATYRADQQIFPIAQDRVVVLLFMVFAFAGVPLLASEYLFKAILIPFLILALAAIGLDLLHGLPARQRAEAVDVVLLMDVVPQLFGAQLGERVLRLQRTAQLHHVGGGVAALDALPARVLGPVLLEECDLLGTGCSGQTAIARCCPGSAPWRPRLDRRVRGP